MTTLDAKNPDPAGEPLKVGMFEPGETRYWENVCRVCGFVNGGHWLVPGGSAPEEDAACQWATKCVECEGKTDWKEVI